MEITGIPSDFWSRDNFKKLKEKLSKLIRPDLNTSEEIQRFKIILSVPDEQEKDIDVIKKFKKESNSEVEQYYNTINGEIKNFVFNELDIKTTRIEANVDGRIITTRLNDRDNFVYEIKEKNDYNLLSNISITLYFLNRSAKNTFKRRTGVEHVEFGSLFIYKNGFRVYPYGERGDDSLRLENRALQGYARYIGLRSLIGEISIIGSNPELRETTSRGDGLVKTKTYEQLTNTEDGFLIKVLRRLEKYVVDVTQWGVNNEDENIDLTSKKAIEELVKLVANISDKRTVELRYNSDILNVISAKEEKSAKKLVQNFKRIAAESNDKKLFKEAEKIEKAISTSLKRADSAEKERDKKVEEKKKAVKELEKRTEQLSIATSIASQDLDNVTNLHHQVFVISDTISSILKEMHHKISNKEEITNKHLSQFIDEIALENNKIETLSRFGMRAIFEDFNSIKVNDINGFIDSYVKKVSNFFTTSKVKVEFKSLDSKIFKTAFRPLDVSIIIDNIINNSKKHKATNLLISTQLVDKDVFQISFEDNGVGFHKDIHDVKEIFKPGFSTTGSTGLGLYHVSNILKSYKWNMDVDRTLQKGALFILTIKK